MPFTVNVGPYRGGEMWQQGLLQAGQNISEGILKAVAENKKIEEEQGADQIILNYGKQIGLVTPEIEADYMKAPHAKKTGIIGGLLRQFTMQQQQAQEQRLAEEAKRIPVTIGDQTFSVHPETAAAVAERAMTAKKEAKTIPYKVGDQTYNIPEAEAARLAASQANNADTADTIDYEDPTNKQIHKVPIRSALGQKLLEKKNPAMALEWNTGLSPDELFNSKMHEAGTLDGNGNFVPIKPNWKGDYDPNAGTHIRIGGQSILKKQEVAYYQNRLKKSGQAPDVANTQTAPEKGSGGPAVGTTRTINGVPAVWDGKGWKPAG